METLPDYLRTGLDIVFVGINPSAYSAKAGHYFANPRNRFWMALNRSGLVEGKLSAETDYTLPDQGIGFTDVVKRPTAQASQLTADEYRRGAPVLKKKLERDAPVIVCFNGVTAYRQYLKYGDGVDQQVELGVQQAAIGTSQVFVAPNPSPANARYSLDALAGWYRQLASLRDKLRGRGPPGPQGRSGPR